MPGGLFCNMIFQVGAYSMITVIHSTPCAHVDEKKHYAFLHHAYGRWHSGKSACLPRGRSMVRVRLDA